MNDGKLKTYDIASYDIELDFNKQITPIEKKIQKLNSSHESKSLLAHKDFLKKEQKSKDTINQLHEKSVLKDQRIERAVENKLKKLQAKENRFNSDLENFISEKTELANTAKVTIEEEITVLQTEEQQQIEDIKLKYKTNIESYVEKLDIYNSNFEKNKTTHHAQINTYQEQLNAYMDDIKVFYNDVMSKLDGRLQEFLTQHDQTAQEISARLTESVRVTSNMATTIRKNANVSITEINGYVDHLIKTYEHHFEPQITAVDDQIKYVKQAFEARTELIQKDLDININKLEAQLDELKDSRNKKASRNILMKIDLFDTRAATTVKYEQRLLEEQVSFLKQQRQMLSDQLVFEVQNLEKLRVILLNDQNDLKESGDYFRDINDVLKEQLNNVEIANNDYVYRHEELKTDFIRRYTLIFSDLKQSTIELTQTYLEKIADNNQEIDDINKFLDTAEPLKEIEVNRLRESIEINEVEERYKIKYAKQQFELNMIDNQLAYDIRAEEINTRELLSEYHKEIAEIKNKEVFDKALEKAKLKHSKAQEIYRQRLNNTKLEQKLLTNKFETERDILLLDKDLAAIDVRKHNALRSKEIEYAIKNYEIEANYKVEVIQKALEEDLLKLEEQKSKATYEKDAYTANLNAEIDLKKSDIAKQKQTIEHKMMEKIRMIDTALERELREPTKNKIKTEAIIDERLSKLDVNNAIFVDFIKDAITGYTDDKLALEQIREIILNNTLIFDKSQKYLTRAFETLNEAITFMSDIEKRNLLNKIASTSDQTKIKKWDKSLQKLEQDLEKNIENVQKSEQDYNVVIENSIKEELKQIKRSNPTTVEELVQLTDTSYHKILTQLTSIQTQLQQEIRSLYAPLTKHDQELIEYAKTNAEKAKHLVEQEQNEQLQPLDEQLSVFIEQKNTQKETFYQTIDKDINELKAQINHLKNEALEKVKEITSDKDSIVNQKLLQKQEIETNEEQEIVIRHEAIDQQISDLTQTYNQALDRLEQKDQEAKKIFDYEDRIHAIAVESATARYNDANVKAENVHMNNVKQYQSQLEQAAQQKDKNDHNYNEELLSLTRSFEKNIFSVRPRLEESIGDAQKEIERQITEKKSILQELLTNNHNIITSAENSLFTAFQEGYDRLSDNLNTYIEKYRLIEQEYLTHNQTSNEAITSNNVQLGNALLEMAKLKHQKTLQQLLAVNTVMYGKEE